ncbi:stage V sporulation protein AA [Bacillus aquiflavi]|uniref:Stage V sporulation protein AA n=1 Tax=Bacillus aquiflavi TaxID=2672567 RepID=A0A6B3W121_9BACI|nr:stage V sporulation protein AA [Bacillus aquiflavi]MBA4537299.1 stage V sporulation protein AA [Bacillus aquiflavi]NEY81556.1 stage V sporulation protein AA [Bacillus aquiflavi]
MEKTVYIRMRHRVQVRPHDSVFLKDVALIIAEDHICSQLKEIVVHKVTDQDQNIIIIDAMKVVDLITRKFKEIEVQTIGPSQTIIEVIFKKKNVSFPLFMLIWFLLFFGAALTIMNFHVDVSMKEVHQRLYTIITGKMSEKPLLFQIPYSLGLGLGMILFFNHVFKKRINEEPSPLEVEMFNYQQDLDQYVIMNENKESMKQLDDD